MLKITLETLKPRNPLVAPSRQRRAGAHRTGASGLRQQAKRALHRELSEMKRLQMSP